MPTLTITRVSSVKHGVEILDDSGNVLHRYEANLLSELAQRKLAARTGLAQHQIATIAGEVRSAPKLPNEPPPSRSIPFTLPGNATGDSGPFRLSVGDRVIERPTPRETLMVLAADKRSASGPVSWSGTERLCCLRVRVPGASESYLTSLASRTQPRATLHHFPGSGWADLLFARTTDYTAEQLAAAAALSLHATDRRLTATTGTGTPYPARPRLQQGTTDLAAAGEWLQREADAAQVREYIEAQGWVAGGRYGHDHCPIDPEGPTDCAEPVQVLNDGVLCSHCASRALSPGRTAGFVPWHSMICGAPPRVATMVRNATHYTHANLVIQAEVPNLADDTLRRVGYCTAVRLLHGADTPAGKAVERAGEMMVRVDDCWCPPDSTVPYSHKIVGMVSSLPAVWVSGTETVDPAKRDLFLQATDLSRYGYPSLTPLHGFPIFDTHNRRPGDKITLPVYPPKFAGAKAVYRPPTQRMREDEAWGMLEEALPGVSRPYIQLLLALKGLAEGEWSQAPFALVVGPSRVQKSGGVHVAAGLSGSLAAEPDDIKPERLNQAIAEGLGQGTYVVLNELFKTAKKVGVKEQAALDVILKLTPESMSHRMWIGPRSLGRLPALVITDTYLAHSVGRDAQTGRRLVLVELHKRVDWETSCAKVGIAKPHDFRLWKPEAALAADSICSVVADRFFRERRTLEAVANDLGFDLLNESTGREYVRARMRELFRLVCEAPPLTPTDAKRVTGPGWKLIKRGQDEPLVDVWGELADGPWGDDWMRSRQVQSEDWAGILGLRETVVAQVKPHNNSVFVRFVVGDPKRPEWSSEALPTWVTTA